MVTKEGYVRRQMLSLEDDNPSAVNCIIVVPHLGSLMCETVGLYIYIC